MRLRDDLDRRIPLAGGSWVDCLGCGRVGVAPTEDRREAWLAVNLAPREPVYALPAEEPDDWSM